MSRTLSAVCRHAKLTAGSNGERTFALLFDGEFWAAATNVNLASTIAENTRARLQASTDSE